MLKHLILIFTLLFSMSALAQTSEEVLEEARFLIKAYEQVPNSTSTSARYLKFMLMQQVVGSFNVENKTLLEMKFKASFDKYNPSRFQGENKNTILQARNIIKELHSFSLTINTSEISQFLKNHHEDGLSIRKSMKDGLYHLHGEIARFAFAIVAVRMATCFGPSLAPLLHFQTPEDFKASENDPACVYEVAEMLQSPLFYIGFTGFILGSRATNAVLLKYLKALDPAQGWMSKVSASLIIPNLALAAGFFTDHMIQTLANNPNIMACAGQLGSGTVNSLMGRMENNSLGTDEEGNQYLGFYDQLGSEHCKRAGRYLSSTQFLAEDMGTGMVGLITTSLALSGVTVALNQIKRISFVFSLTGVGGFVVATTRMVVFLGLFEIIGPIVKNAYYDRIVQPKVEQKHINLISKLNRTDPTNMELKDQETCSEHYSGFADEENLEICSKIPLLSDLYSFRDYSQTWRSKKILGSFHEKLHRWKQKLTSYISHYFSAMEHLRILSRTREIKLTGKSEYYTEYEKAAKKKISDFIKENYDEGTDPQELLNRIASLHDTFLNHPDNDVAQQAKDTIDSNPNDRYIFDIIHQYEGQKDLITNTLSGMPFWGLGAGITGEYYPDAGFIEEFRLKTIAYLKSGVTPRFLMQGGRHYQQFMQLDSMGVNIEDVMPHQPQTIINFISSGNTDEIALGFLLLSEWIDFYFGEERITDSNQKGLNDLQMELREEILATLETFTPLFRYDAIYFEYSGVKDYLFLRKKSPEDAQWDSQNYMVSTETLTDLTLAELMCGHQDNFLNYFFGDSGTALEFKYPHLSDLNHCENYFYPLHYPGEILPAPTRTVFTTFEGFRTGLHQIYIQADSDSHPLVFDSEQAAGDWWNKEYRDPSLEKLKEMNGEYDKFLANQFTPKFDTSVLEPFWQWVNWLNPFKNPFRSPIDTVASTENASESLYSELQQYIEIAKKIHITADESQLRTTTDQLLACFVDLLGNLTSKNYSNVKSQCLNIRNQLKDSLWYQNQKRSEALIQELLRKDEAELSSEEIRDIILIHVYVQIEKLFSEVDLYQHIQDGQFKFNLELEGDKE